MTCPPTREQRLEAERDRFREVLEFYANEKNYDDETGAPGKTMLASSPMEPVEYEFDPDMGTRARAALSGSGRAEGSQGMSELLKMRMAREELHRAVNALYANVDADVARGVHASFLKYESAVLEVVTKQNDELIALAERLERAE